MSINFFIQAAFSRIWTEISRWLYPSPMNRRELELLRLNLKVFASNVANNQPLFGQEPEVTFTNICFNRKYPNGLTSKLCQQADFEIGTDKNHSLYAKWMDTLKLESRYHRKQWEYFFLLQALFEAGFIKIDQSEEQKLISGLGFAIGRERMPAYFAKLGMQILATDAPEAVVAGKGWVTSNQHASNGFFYPDLVEKDIFNQKVKFQAIDMNSIPISLDNQFDFCWSLCSLEHLGSLEAGLQFIVNSMKTLKPGGIAVHTTEFNCFEEEKTIKTGPTVIFRKKDIIFLQQRLSSEGYEMAPMNWDLGSDPLDLYIDLTPFSWSQTSSIPGLLDLQKTHLKLSLDGYACTSIGLIIRKIK